MKEWMSQADAARLRGVSRQAISKLVQKGKLRTLTIGGHVLVHRDDILGEEREHLIRESGLVVTIKQMLIEAPDQDRTEIFQWLRETQQIHPLENEFGAKAEVILEAIARSPDLTKRGIRGIIAEAVFKVDILEQLPNWHDVTPEGDLPFDFLITDGLGEISIQLKMQRLKEQRPMIASEGYRVLDPEFWVVETQRTRGGKTASGEDTRPYKFGEFDLLAVSMHPSTGNWSDFLFTVANWLLERPDNTAQLLKFQPVPRAPNEFWTDNLDTAVEWIRSSEKRQISGRKEKR